MFAYSFGALLFGAIPGFWEIAKAESERPLPVILVVTFPKVREGVFLSTHKLFLLKLF